MPAKQTLRFLVQQNYTVAVTVPRASLMITAYYPRLASKHQYRWYCVKHYRLWNADTLILLIIVGPRILSRERLIAIEPRKPYNTLHLKLANDCRNIF